MLFSVSVSALSTTAPLNHINVNGALTDGIWANIEIGTPPQTVSVLFDTGSSTLAVSSNPDPQILRFVSSSPAAAGGAGWSVLILKERTGPTERYVTQCPSAQHSFFGGPSTSHDQNNWCPIHSPIQTHVCMCVYIHIFIHIDS